MDSIRWTEEKNELLKRTTTQTCCQHIHNSRKHSRKIRKKQKLNELLKNCRRDCIVFDGVLLLPPHPSHNFFI